VAALSVEELKRLCGILYDVEETAQLRYEILRRSAEERGDPLPVEPRTLLGGDKRKELHRVAAEPRLVVAYASLERKFIEAQMRSPDAPLPAPFQPLGLKARERALGILSTDEHLLYAVTLLHRADALMLGRPLPPERETQLPESVRLALKKLLRDRRMGAYLSQLMERTLQGK
jgi:hypothetical protein